MWGLLFAALKAAYLWSFGRSMILAPEQKGETPLEQALVKQETSPWFWETWLPGRVFIFQSEG